MNDKFMDWKQIADELLFQQMQDHPLPWHIEHDWTYEVTAADGHIIAKCRFPGQAGLIIQRAGFWQKDIEDFGRKLDLSDACREVVSEDKCDDLINMPFDEALGYAFTLLTENGIEDPHAYLVEHDVLE